MPLLAQIQAAKVNYEQLAEKLKHTEEERKKIYDLGFPTFDENKQLKAKIATMSIQHNDTRVRLIAAEAKFGSLGKEIEHYKEKSHWLNERCML